MTGVQLSLKSTSRKIVVVGSGLTGLACAFWLQQAGYSTSLLETEESIGGLGGVFTNRLSLRLSKFHTFIGTADADMLDFLDATGCRNLFSSSSESSILFGQKSFTSSGLTEHRDYYNTIASALKTVNDWKSLEEHLATDWLEALVPQRYIREVWIPRLKGRFGSCWQDISAAWLWSEFANRKLPTGETRLWPISGWAVVMARLHSSLNELGVEIRTRETVRRLERTPQHTWAVITDNGVLEADLVIATVSVPMLIELAGHQLDPILLKKLDKVTYVGNRCVVVGVDGDISKYWEVDIRDRQSALFLGVVQWIQPNNTLLYMSRYISQDDPQYVESDEVYIKDALEWLQSHLSRKLIFRTQGTWRSSYSQHVLTRNYSECLPPQQLHPGGLWYGTMAQTYPNQRSKSTAVGIGTAIAKEIIANTQSELP